MAFSLTAAKKAELEDVAEETGISYEALVESEEISYLLETGGVEAVKAAGYHVTGKA